MKKATPNLHGALGWEGIPAERNPSVGNKTGIASSSLSPFLPSPTRLSPTLPSSPLPSLDQTGSGLLAIASIYGP